MPGSVPVFRVFVSLTFADLSAERAAMHSDVLPSCGRCVPVGAPSSWPSI
jgi:hypothetical protein